jgi:amino-acid N-acetyltransferase
MKQDYRIRLARFKDAEGIFHLIKRYREELLPRPIGDIVKNIDRFLVCEIDGKLAGTVSWAILPEIGAPHQPSVEIKSLAVIEEHRKSGIGRSLVQAAIEKIKPYDPTQIVALTFCPDFFVKLGFVKTSKEALMHKIYAGCVNCTKYDSPFTCPEVAMSLDIEKSAKPSKPRRKR